MYIKHDYSYLGEGKNLIDKGYAELDIHSLIFDRYYTEEEKQSNSKEFETMTTDQWNKRCEETSQYIYSQLLPIKEIFNSKYDVHQITEERSTMEHHKSNWDLFYYSNQGWNNKDYFDYITLSFNTKRASQDNISLFNEILSLLEKLEVKNVYCRVQYSVRKNEEKIKNKAIEICNKLLEKTIEYQGMNGKIKVIGGRNNEKIYGFFKARARKTYYKISDTYMILNY